jgi:hypothetical protein
MTNGMSCDNGEMCDTCVKCDYCYILFYTCGIEVDGVTRGDEMTRGQDDQGMK